MIWLRKIGSFLRALFPFAFLSYHKAVVKKREIREKLEGNFYFNAWKCVGAKIKMVPRYLGFWHHGKPMYGIKLYGTNGHSGELIQYSSMSICAEPGCQEYVPPHTVAMDQY
ncbi:MAG: hypothetical protein G01um101420_888 [Parcubacteria group bacterium Gr01-1014_20]|nr:MAG: hypothetical protein G01um101420_888 [Parcubacteria group bacterium Gr01-1014_20]